MKPHVRWITAGLAMSMGVVLGAEETAAPGVAAEEAIAAAAKAENTPRVSDKEVEARLSLARRLLTGHQYKEALAEYLWLYDVGMTGEVRFRGVRNSYVTSEMGQMAREYQPAAEALRVRRDAAENRLMHDLGGKIAATEVAALNDALGDDRSTLDMLQRVPFDDVRRPPLISRVFRHLVDNGRYKEAVAIKPYAQVVAEFNRSAGELGKEGPDRVTYVGVMVRTVALGIEALVGAGDLQGAREAVKIVLKVDASKATKTELRRRLERVRHAELVP